MNFTQLLETANKPQIYTPGTSVMWTDPHISKQLLQTHLNTEIDLASRKQSNIDSTVDWIFDQVKSKNLNILDLGCGPGLYTELFAKRGHKVKGVDISPNSISYAEQSALKKGLDIDYCATDYLSLEAEAQGYDLITMIYTDMGVLTPSQRTHLLKFIASSLKPGGTVIFDVLCDRDIEQKITPPSWEAVQSNGFWSDKPYLALSNSFHYQDEKVILYQHVILEDNVKLSTYRFWTHYFSPEDIHFLLKDHSFSSIEISDKVLGEEDLWSGKNVLFCKAVKS